MIKILKRSHKKIFYSNIDTSIHTFLNILVQNNQKLSTHMQKN